MACIPAIIQAQTATLIQDIETGTGSSIPEGYFEYKGNLYFSAGPSGVGFELYSYDGNSVQLISDIHAGSPSSAPADFVEYNGNLYFAASTNANGREVYVYDGTSVSLAFEVFSGPATSNPFGLTVYNNKLVFSAGNNGVDTELYEWDGTNVTRVADIRSGTASSSPRGFTEFNNSLYFVANDGISGNELWSYDGTNVNMVSDINTSGGSFGSDIELVVYNNKLVFPAENNSSGLELFEFDGTNTTLIQDIRTGSADSRPRSLTEYNGVLYFGARDNISGNELRSYNGTTVSLVEDIYPGTTGSGAWEMKVLGAKLYFAASTPAYGAELMTYDGTNVRLAFDLRTGTGGSSPEHLTTYKGNIIFTAFTNATGSEPFEFSNTQAVCPSYDFTWQPNSTCIGDTITFTIPFPLNGASVSWDFGDGTTSTDTTGQHAFAANGIFAVEMTVSKQGCPDAIVTRDVVVSGITLNAGLLHPSTVGGSNGAIDLLVGGGNQPYTYNWSTNATTEDITGLTAGNYSVTVTDVNGCSNTATYTLSDPQTLEACLEDTLTFTPVDTSGGRSFSWNFGDGTTSNIMIPTHYYGTTGTFVVSLTVVDTAGCATTSFYNLNIRQVEITAITATNVLCNGDSSGTATVTATGGTTPYSYLWSNGQTTQTATGLTAGTYSVTVTDVNGCSDDTTITVIEPTPVVASATVIQNVSCYGFADGEATASASGGTPGYTFSWSNGQTGSDATGLAAGTYTVIATDANGCTDTATVIITQPDSLVATTQVLQNVSCNGFADGEATVNVTGGTAPYAYNWSNGQTTQTINGLAAGTYTVTVTDDSSCTTTATVTITEPTPLVANGTVLQNVSCNGFADGEATVNVTGGTSPYAYNWSNGQTSQTATGLAAGTYTVTVTDDSSCTITASVTITEPPLLVATASVLQNVSCNGFNDGEATVNATGGTAPYAYQWSANAGSQTTQTATGLAAGTYTVTVTDDSSCTAVDTITITQPNLMTANVTVDNNVSCYGFSDGQATANVTGGSAPYSFNWSNGQTTQTATGLAAGTYTVTVTDDSSCTTTASVTITQPDSLIATAVVDQNVSCNGFADGEATVSATGGTTPYSYLWSNGQTTATATGLGAGTYIVTVTDTNGCDATASIQITEPPILVGTINADTNVSCNGFSDGQASIMVTGGTPPYSYLWSDGQTGPVATNLASGLYSVTVTDDSNCTYIDSVFISQPSPLVLQMNVNTNVSCAGFADGEADVNVFGGTPSYTYLWSNGATSFDLVGVGAGTYFVTVTDANGCTAVDSVVITEPNPIISTATVIENVSCYGFADGIATVTASGGTPGFNFTWSNGQTTATATGLAAGKYIVTITDNNGCTKLDSVTITEPDSLVATAQVLQNVSCNGFADGEATVNVTGGTSPYTFNWSNGQTTQTATGLAAGTYTVTVTDDSSCTATATITITEPTPLVANTQVLQNTSCYGFADGEATVTVTGGTSPYSFNWSNGQTTQTATGLAAGTYTVTVTDDSSCTTTATVTITQPDSLVATAQVLQNVSCNGFADGEVTVNVTGGTAPFTFNWSNGQTTQTATGLAAGTYTVTVTDDSSCTDVATVTITEPTPLTASTQVLQNVSCYGFADGEATVTASGGTAPYSYNWSNGQNSQTATGLAAGTYTVTVTDDSSCTITATVTITQPDSLVATTQVLQNVSCNGFADGEATVNVTGGSGSYRYNWSNGQTTQTISGLAAGTYGVTVLDDSNCVATATVTITQPPLLQATAQVLQNVSCNGFADGEATITANGGTPPYNYNWSNGATTQTINGLAAGTYTVTVTDDSNCVYLDSITITEPPLLVVTGQVLQNASCNGFTDGEATVNVTGGTAPFTFNWSNGQTTQTATGLGAGTYTVTVTDDSSCTATATVNITEPAVLITSTQVLQNVSCYGFADGEATITVNGGTTPYTINWSNGQTGNTATGLAAGLYTVTVTDDSACTVVDSVTITQPDSLLLTPQVLQNVSCNGFADGEATVTVTGGTPPFTYNWNSGQTTPTITGLAAGTYTLTVTDDSSCTAVVSVTITQPLPLATSTQVLQNVSCNGFADGEATITVTGGTAPYAYNWSNGQTTQTATGLAAGTYFVTVTDDSTCTITDSVTITEPPLLTATTQVNQNASCNGFNDGSATVLPTGGTAPYSYLWSNGQTTQTATGLTAGTYTVTVTDDSTCTVTATVTITEPPVLVPAAVVIENVSCNGFADGVATASASGGTPGYTFVWSNGQTTATATGLAAGTYTVTVTDSNGCFDSTSITITEPPLLVANAQILQNVSCNGFADGEATVNVTGGTTPYSYNWSNGQTTQTATGLAAGTYSVTVTDDSACVAIDSITITEPPLLVATGQVLQNVSCYGFADGEATVNVTGGTAPFSYNWSNGQTSQTATGLAAGTYTVTVTDDSSCTTTATVTITQPDSLVAAAQVVQNVSCFGYTDGVATVNGTGGTLPYAYNWSNGQTTQTATGLAAGTYTVTITDDSSCTATATVTITQPDSLIATTQVLQNVSCNGFADGEATVTVVGGTAPFSYAWSNGQTTQTATGLAAGQYIVTVTDDSSCTAIDTVTITEPPLLTATPQVLQNVSCNGFADGEATVVVNGGTPPYSYNWSNGQTTQTATGLAAGTYSVTVTDDSACVVIDSITITEPPLLVINASVIENVSCNGFSDGIGTVSATGGTPPYTYAWSNGRSSATVTGLSAGQYIVTVTDDSACVAIDTITITEPAPLTAATSVIENVSCFGFADGIATVTGTGGTPPYSYAWSNGQTTQTATGLAAGTYNVTITDDSSCNAIASVTITEPAPLVVTPQVLQNVSCNGFSDGEITVNVTGGTAPYTYNWSNGQTTQTITGLAAGTYTVTVTDDSSCVTIDSITVTEPTPLAATIVVDQNVSCNGFADGEATVVTTGGTAPYSYLWSNGQTTQTATGLAAGTYTVTVTDDSTCTTTATVTITEPLALVANAFPVQNVSCYGFADGEATVSVTGGTPGYSYLWSNGQTTQNATGLAAGTYTVTVTDDSSCTITATVTITQPDSLVLTTTVLTNVTCNGFADGSANVSVTGGTAPFSYNWSNGQTGPTATGLAAGTYTVTVTDDSSCTATASVTITEPTPLVATTTVDQNVSCNGFADGQATVSATGGTAPYSYSWSNGQTGATATGLAAGTYTVTVTDDSSCTTTATVTITQPDPIVTNTQTLQNVSCYGFADGEATVSVTGGTPGYSYSWSNGQNTQNATGLAAGRYYVTVTDANNCTTVDSITITQPDSLTATATVIENVSCNGFADGVAIANPTGGSAPYSYNWSNGQTTRTATGLAAGTYTVTITDDSSCTTTATVTITEPPLLVVNATVLQNVSCNGFPDGEATVTATGGTPPYSYNWSNGQNTPGVSGLAAGTYTVTVTDDSSCTVVDTIVITEPAPLVATASVVQNVSCNGFSDGVATVTGSGGTAPYAYLWSNGQTTQTATGLAAGTYTVTITDDSSCTATASVTITEPTPLVVSATVDQNVSCNGFADGEATVTASGGSAPYSYLWSNGQTGATATGLAAGTYIVTVTDDSSCTATATVTITEPTPLVVNTTVDQNVSCNGFADGQATVTATGGTAPYSYNWSNGQTGATATGLAAGTYTVTVTDDSSCTATATVTITEPAPLVLTPQVLQNVSCNGFSDGVATVTVTGGTTPYSYSWSNGQVTQTATGLAAGTYTVTVTDDSSCTATATVTITEPAALTANASVVQNVSCNGFADGEATVTVTGGTAPYSYNWSNGQTGATATGLAAGTYTVTVTDDSSCTTTATVTITEPAPLVITATVDQNVSCNGFADGQASVSVTGGTAPYSYSWSNGQTGATATGLAAGTYTVTVTDDSSCTATATVTITQPAPLQVSLSVDNNVSCNGFNDGQATALVTGGTAPYSFNWSNGQTTATATGLAAGTYSVTITDDSSCTYVDSVTITEPAPMVATASVVNNVSCFGFTDGSATVNTTGGTAPYNYAWSNGQTTQTINNLAAGTYTVTVTDQNGCTDTSSVTITQPLEQLAINIQSQSNVSCNGFNDGAVSVTVQGGTPTYSYLWSNGATTPAITGLSAGSYTLTVTDANGCTETLTINITEPPVLGATVNVDQNVSCNGFADGQATVTATGGTPAYSYNWSNGQTTATATGLAAGTYTVTVSDANFCDTVLTVTITEPTPLVVTTTVDQNASCNGFSDGQATASATGGTPGYAFAWSNGQTTATATNLAAGTYTVTVTDTNGCTTTGTVTITEPAALTANITIDQQISCFGFSDGQVTVNATGGTPGYAYIWSTGAVTATVSGLNAGTYSVTVTDQNGCTVVTSVTLSNPAQLVTSTTVNQNVSCNGFADGSATVSASGGTPGYTYNWSNGQTTATATGLAGGSYTVTVTDANGCTAVDTVTITEPAPLVVTTTIDQNASCNSFADGQATASATGGTPGYTFSWSNGQTGATATGLAAGTYTVTATDTNGCTATATVTITEPPLLIASTTVNQNVSCNGFSDGQATVTASGGTPGYAYLWSTGASTQTASGLSAGLYTVTVTDTNGCTAVASVTITQPAPLSSTTTVVKNATCNGFADGEASVSVTGGTPNYSYSWSNGSTGTTATGLGAGTYYVTITDANGCTLTDSVTITQPTGITATITSQTDVSCNGFSDGSATVSATGGTPGYTYSWSNGQTGTTATNLSAGTYTVTVTDANGCTATASVTINEPAPLNASTNVDQNASCNGFSDGQATVTVTGGTAPYLFSWSNGQNTPTATALAAGTYTVTITDDNGCTTTASVTITEPQPINTGISGTNVSCNGGLDGTATVTPNGGTAPYSYLWSDGQTTQTATALNAGTYTVTVTDANGCFAIDSITITEPPILVVTLVGNESCSNDNSGSITSSVSGGTPGYTYLWNTGATTASLTNIPPGTYTLQVTDSRGCTRTVTITLNGLIVPNSNFIISR